MKLERIVDRRTLFYSALILGPEPGGRIHIIPSGFVEQFYVIMEHADEDDFNCQRVFKHQLPMILGASEVAVEDILTAAQLDVEKMVNPTD